MSLFVSIQDDTMGGMRHRLAAGALALLVACSSGDETPPIGRAAQKGWTARDMPAAGEAWFPGLDGGVELSPAAVRGRNTWMVWTGGNEAMWDHFANHSFGTFDLLKTLSSHPALPGGRSDRFRRLGLWNEPGFEEADGPDPERHGLWLDRRVGEWRDPFEDGDRYPGVDGGALYGEPSGIVGLRLFPNPAFDEEARRRWDPDRYYTDSKYYLDRELVRPYRVGMACSFCHVGASPVAPPADPEGPAWSELSAYVGSQYFRNGTVFYYDPDPGNFLFQLFDAPPRGTNDTSFLATDTIFNPRTMNAIYSVGARLDAAGRWGSETLSGRALANPSLGAGEGAAGAEVVTQVVTQVDRDVPHILKDGADSVGVLGALNRVYVNIGMFHEEWFRHFNPLLGGVAQRPLDLESARERSTYWSATEARTPDVAQYFLEAARPHRLRDAPGGADRLEDDAEVMRSGRLAFADHCAGCHSSKLPAAEEAGVPEASGAYWEWLRGDEGRAALREIVLAEDFLKGNYLSNDRRIAADVLGTNLCSPAATNATAGHIWEAFSSDSYRALPAIGPLEVEGLPGVTADRTWELGPGGPGYTRVPSLIGVWASAPLLLSNTLGEYTGDPSVEGRLQAFDSAMEQLLWPELRRPFVPRTTEVSHLEIAVAYLRSPLDRLVGFVSRWFGNGVIEIGPIPKGTPVGLLANLDLNRPERHGELLRLVPRIATSLAKISTERMSEAEATELLRREVAPSLLALNTCPDFVLNRGHEFGSELSDARKRALIEFVRTF